MRIQRDKLLNKVNGKEIYISPVKMDNVLMKIIRKKNWIIIREIELVLKLVLFLLYF